MLVQDAAGCRAEGMRPHRAARPHQQRWVDGGRTDLADGVSLCHWHHHRAHDTRYQTTYHPNGDVTFHMRT